MLVSGRAVYEACVTAFVSPLDLDDLSVCQLPLRMADYWKSNPKKYCDLCKCWIADNKISIQNHENGMRHKASVAKKVNDLTRSNNDAEIEKRKLEACLQQINDSAHISMMKDLERDPSLAKQYGIELAKEIKANNNNNEETLSKTEKSLPAKSRPDPPKPENIWRESITPDGKHYYWNAVTRVTQWTRPDGIIEPDNRTVKQEKDRLKDFVFNRLVELSESGSKGANEAVLQAFNASVEDDISTTTAVVEKPTVDNHNERPSTPEPPRPVEFRGPRIDLLGPWVACEDVPKPKLPKLDLPVTTNNVVYSQNPELNEKLSVIAHLEEATEKSIENASLFNPVEKVIHPGSCLGGGGGSSKKSEDDNSCKVEQSSSSNPARIVFRRRQPGSNRSIRAPQSDD
ncbi:unnamed protein product [Trichobilharzia szidati]|nr:unnamed protein product [Trichobilharzia szidati]